MCSLSVMKVPDALSFLLVMYSCSEGEEKKKKEFELTFSCGLGYEPSQRNPMCSQTAASGQSGCHQFVIEADCLMVLVQGFLCCLVTVLESSH